MLKQARYHAFIQITLGGLTMLSKRKVASLLLLSWSIIASTAPAQVATAELVGNVTDATGAAVPGAKITAVNTATNITAREVESGADGGYIMTFLPPATYTISVEKAGFRKTAQTGLTLEVNQRARVDFALQVGQVTETVEVAAAAPLLESQSSSIGNVVGQRFVTELPLYGRI